MYHRVLMCVGSSRPTSPHTTHISVTQLSNNVTTLPILLNTYKLHTEKRFHVKGKILRHERTEITTNRFVISLFKYSIFYCCCVYSGADSSKTDVISSAEIKVNGHLPSSDHSKVTQKPQRRYSESSTVRSYKSGSEHTASQPSERCLPPIV